MCPWGGLVLGYALVCDRTNYIQLHRELLVSLTIVPPRRLAGKGWRGACAPSLSLATATYSAGSHLLA